MTPAQTALDRAAEAMEAERARYEVAFSLSRENGLGPPYTPWGVVEKTGDTYVVHLKDGATRAECEAWIARQAFAAGLESLIIAGER